MSSTFAIAMTRVFLSALLTTTPTLSLGANPFVPDSRGEYVDETRDRNRLIETGHDPDDLQSSAMQGEIVVDAGCGSQAIWARQLRSENIQSFAIDLAVDPTLNLPYVFQGDMRQIDFVAPGTVDRIFSTWSLLSYRRPTEFKIQALQKFEELLKQGGLTHLSPVDPFEIERLLAEVPQLEMIKIFYRERSDYTSVTLRKRAANTASLPKEAINFKGSGTNSGFYQLAMKYPKLSRYFAPDPLIKDSQFENLKTTPLSEKNTLLELIRVTHPKQLRNIVQLSYLWNYDLDIVEALLTRTEIEPAEWKSMLYNLQHFEPLARQCSLSVAHSERSDQVLERVMARQPP